MEKQDHPILTCKDFTVSGEYFELFLNENLEMLETKPMPAVKELSKYYESVDYISHTDSKKTFVDKLYQYVKKRALLKKLQLVNSFKTKEKKLLDVGCGTGDFLNICKPNGWEVTGVEPNAQARILAGKKLGDSFEVLNDLSDVKVESFDIISLWHVLEHVPNLDDYISRLNELLADDGVLIVAVPNYKSFDAKYYKEFWAAYDVPRHLWHFSQNSIDKLFEKVSMKVISKKPMWFDSFYVSLLSEKYRKGSIKFFKAFFIGLLSNLKGMSTKEYSSIIYIIKKA